MRCMTAITPAPFFFSAAGAVAVDTTSSSGQGDAEGESTGDGDVSEMGVRGLGQARVVYTNRGVDQL
ncbi:hypothetical protein GCM10010215_44600 [Streptomyces virginiae]|uniref:Uncharacterized protein n=1 Tax=Streptomyces virginiae TaxID=1961 RepID=A0ABQ3NX13_STRVG|nr:hypothetical protein GCM10010215_44600 [Streptomyces virginiae]GHI17311.1 hypothetical protein Scinn_67740 [Streptomyces virginiae]